MQSSGTPKVIALKRLCYYKYFEKYIVTSYITVAILPSVLTDGRLKPYLTRDFSPSFFPICIPQLTYLIHPEKILSSDADLDSEYIVLNYLFVSSRQILHNNHPAIQTLICLICFY